MRRNLIIGDVHGRYDRLMDVLEKGCFDPDTDNLYSVGDFADRGSEPVSVLRYLRSIRHFFPVLGNHDLWLRDYLLFDLEDEGWTVHNGGAITVEDFRRNNVSTEEKRELGAWLDSMPAVRITPEYIILHGGNAGMSEAQLSEFAAENERVDESNSLYDCLWDRDYLFSAYGHAEYQPTFFELPMQTDKLIFIGHTPLETRPLYFPSYHLVATDSRAGRPEGFLSLIDMDTLEYWQSDHKGSSSLV